MLPALVCDKRKIVISRYSKRILKSESDLFTCFEPFIISIMPVVKSAAETPVKTYAAVLL